MAIIGYARVSTTDQNPQLQLDALHEAGAIAVFTDHGVSGSTAADPDSTPASTTFVKAMFSPSGNSTGSGATPNTSSPSSTT